jgi:hypothetical protein
MPAVVVVVNLREGRRHDPVVTSLDNKGGSGGLQPAANIHNLTCEQGYAPRNHNNG